MPFFNPSKFQWTVSALFQKGAKQQVLEKHAGSIRETQAIKVRRKYSRVKCLKEMRVASFSSGRQESKSTLLELLL